VSHQFQRVSQLQYWAVKLNYFVHTIRPRLTSSAIEVLLTIQSDACSATVTNKFSITSIPNIYADFLCPMWAVVALNLLFSPLLLALNNTTQSASASFTSSPSPRPLAALLSDVSSGWKYSLYTRRILRTSNQIINCKKTIKLTPRPRMALNGAKLQQQLTVLNTGAEPKKVKM